MARFMCKFLINLIVKWLLGPFVAVVSVCMYSVCRDETKRRVKETTARDPQQVKTARKQT